MERGGARVKEPSSSWGLVDRGPFENGHSTEIDHLTRNAHEVVILKVLRVRLDARARVADPPGCVVGQDNSHRTLAGFEG